MRSDFLPFAAIGAVAVLLAGCDQAPAPEPVATETPAAAPTPIATPGLPADFSSSDCGTVLKAYAAALANKDFDIATNAWAEPTVDAERLAARYRGYAKPELVVGEIKDTEGAAGSLYCEATVTLRDTDDPQRPLRQGTLVLRRANEVPGASEEQLRWRIESSTLAEDLERASLETPA